MTTRKPHLILHVGAPKCGSSALQTALSMTPDLHSADGTHYRYTVARSLAAGRWLVEQGAGLTQWARMSAYGYTSWPNLRRGADKAGVFTQLHQVMCKGRQQNHVPIVSCEGWINHPDSFAQALKDWGNPPVDVVIFLRPVVDWMNAAFWQWGRWHARDLDVWMARGNMSYSFADDIAAWSDIPNLRVIVRNQRPDVVAKFAEIYGLPLEGARQSNMASSPALIGFLLRNRHYRPSGHTAANEFIVQRWCPSIPSEKLWAVKAEHVRRLRKVNNRSLRIFKERLAPEDLEDLLVDPRWGSEKAYHNDLAKGVTRLNDRALCAPLYDAMCAGACAACKAAGLSAPVFPDPLGADAAVEEWDVIITTALETLLAADDTVRKQVVPRWKREALKLLLRLRKGHLVKRS